RARRTSAGGTADARPLDERRSGARRRSAGEVAGRYPASEATPLRGGVGVGWRPEIAGVVGALPGLRFCEVIAESLHPAPAVPPRGVAELRGRGVAVVPHGVRLSLGGAEPLEPARV